jgi:DNA-binding protein HU-beta
MRYRELINAVAIRAHRPTAEVEHILQAYSDQLIATLKTGDLITHKNLAVFYVAKRTARIGVNPRTQQPINIKAMKLVAARFARSAHEKLN